MMGTRAALLALLVGIPASALGGCADCCPCCSPTPPPPAGKPSSAAAGKEAPTAPRTLFDGKSLGSWASVEFGGQGKVSVEQGAIRVEAGASLSGIRWTGEAPPRTNYELRVEAMKLDGNDFLLGLVFPVGQETCSFVAGGWGGGLTGLSSVDSMNASENETATDQTYHQNRWYAFRLRVTPERIEVWLDTKQVVNLELANRHISVHPAVESAAPLGLCNYETTSLFRNITLQSLK